MSDLTFECNCDGTGYKGSTCERGIISVPEIPMLSQDVEYRFNITARTLTDMIVHIYDIRDDEYKHLYERVYLSRSVPTAEASFPIDRVGQHTLHYTLEGAAADQFDPPQNQTIFVAPRQRRPEELNAYFLSVKSEVGFLNGSCCLSSFTYLECPMTTDSVTFSSTCSWTANNNAVQQMG